MSIGAWEPLWIGPASRRLYAALHLASGADVGVVLVPPLLHELPRSRRFLTEVASELATMGLACLRFDFHGSGDSAGEGGDMDFGSMRRDLDDAVAALRAHAGVRRVAVLAWRGSALALHGWIDHGGRADLVVLWEPVVDGNEWLQSLVAGDSAERALRPPPRAGVPRLTDPADGQLMGFAVSPRLRADLAHARLHGHEDRTTRWAIVRADAAALPFETARLLRLPANAPGFGEAAAMDATFFLTPPVRALVGQLGQALRSEAWA